MKTKMTKDKRNKSSPWVLRWSEGIDPETGEERWRQKSFQYKLQAERFRAELKVNGAATHTPGSGGGVSLVELKHQWLRTRGKQLAPSTVDLYRNTFSRLEKFFGGHRLLTNIMPQQAEEFIAAQRNLVPSQNGKSLSQSSRNQILRNCRSLFNTAIKWRYVTTNPFDSVGATRPEQRRFHRFTPKQHKALLEVAPTLREKVLYDVLLTTGGRKSEVLSRTWGDIDFENGMMVISNREATDDLPPFKVKSRRERSIPLSNGTLDLLTQLQAEAPEGVPYVFLTEPRYEQVKKKWHKIRAEGKPWKNRWLLSNVLRNFKKHCHRAGIKPTGTLTVHSLRKNAGQDLADAGLPLNVVQAILGHSDPSTTLRHYSQVDQHHMKQVAKAIDGRLGRRKKRSNSKQKYVSGTYDQISGNSPE